MFNERRRMPGHQDRLLRLDNQTFVGDHYDNQPATKSIAAWLGWPDFLPERKAEAKELPHYVLPDGRIRFDFVEIWKAMKGDKEFVEPSIRINRGFPEAFLKSPRDLYKVIVELQKERRKEENEFTKRRLTRCINALIGFLNEM